ncbi:MAG TPA: hypothetical protein VEX37_05605 [Thermomicrobiales bacterium]|nr:hypothetical protein [Thermomicrobiales bacterium]
MTGYIAGCLLLGAVAGSPQGVGGAQLDEAAELSAFAGRVSTYVEVHRRLEGPIPPLMAGKDMQEVYRLMAALRGAIRAERGAPVQGALVTPQLAIVLRNVVSRTLTVEDLIDLDAELLEHTPRSMRKPCVNEQRPEGAPFVMIAPQLLSALPPLPPELRYIALSKALVIWDHHADLVVEVVPGLFDPESYRTTLIAGPPGSR